jgi:hypothetical protein
MKNAGPLVLPSLTLKAPVAAKVLATIPLGPNGGAIGNKPGTGQGTVGVPEEMHGISTTSGTIVPSPVKGNQPPTVDQIRILLKGASDVGN